MCFTNLDLAVVNMEAQKVDLILYGATGFTGKQVAFYIGERVKEGWHLEWGIAGRSQEKLDALVKIFH